MYSLTLSLENRRKKLQKIKALAAVNGYPKGEQKTRHKTRVVTSDDFDTIHNSYGGQKSVIHFLSKGDEPVTADSSVNMICLWCTRTRTNLRVC
jgi:hypothetical protein